MPNIKLILKNFQSGKISANLVTLRPTVHLSLTLGWGQEQLSLVFCLGGCFENIFLLLVYFFISNVHVVEIFNKFLLAAKKCLATSGQKNREIENT